MPLKKIIRVLGSLPFAIFLIGGLAVILTVSTFLESLYGTPFAQKTFYTARWFDLFLSLVWVNIFCATLTRYPFKKKHIGFVITHIGILLLLVGALLSRLLGIEGQMTLFEGQARDSILQEGYELKVARGKEAPVSFPIQDKQFNRPVRLALDENAPEIYLSEVLPNAMAKVAVLDGGENTPLNRAGKLSLKSGTVGVEESFWLMEKNPEDPHAHARQIGPALFMLEADAPDAPPTLRITLQKSGETYTLALKKPFPESWPLGDTGLTVSKIEYFPSAKIVENKLVNLPEEVRFNPAVRFFVSDTEGRTEKHTRFLLFPHFDSLHGGSSINVFDLAVRLEAALPADLMNTGSPSFTLKARKGGPWHYRITSSRNDPVEGPLVPGEAISTGWMDMQVTVDKTIDRAKLETQVKKAETPSEGDVAVRLLSFDKEENQRAHWVFPGLPLTLPSAQGPLSFSLEPVAKKVPFQLQLRDFRKVDYPGTQNPASYESDVVLHDPQEKLTIAKTISMNKPLDHKGFRIFQSSYIQDPKLGEASVFTIAKNPGILLIYGGGCVILIGVVLLFYFHPFFREGKTNGG